MHHLSDCQSRIYADSVRIYAYLDLCRLYVNLCILYLDLCRLYVDLCILYLDLWRQWDSIWICADSIWICADSETLPGSVQTLYGSVQTVRLYLDLCRQWDSWGSSPASDSSGSPQPPSSAAAPASSPPSPGLWMLSGSPSPPSSPWLSLCPPPPPPCCGVSSQDPVCRSHDVAAKRRFGLSRFSLLGRFCVWGLNSDADLCTESWLLWFDWSRRGLTEPLSQCRFPLQIQIFPKRPLCAKQTFQSINTRPESVYTRLITALFTSPVCSMVSTGGHASRNAQHVFIPSL